MGNKAYLVGFLNRYTGEYEGCEIFSEENPTCSFTYLPFTLFWRSGDSYEAAEKSLEEVLDLPEYSFLKQKLNKRTHP